jgi:hypothetical protein
MSTYPNQWAKAGRCEVCGRPMMRPFAGRWIGPEHKAERRQARLPQPLPSRRLPASPRGAEGLHWPPAEAIRRSPADGIADDRHAEAEALKAASKWREAGVLHEELGEWALAAECFAGIDWGRAAEDYDLAGDPGEAAEMRAAGLAAAEDEALYGDEDDEIEDFDLTPTTSEPSDQDSSEDWTPSPELIAELEPKDERDPTREPVRLRLAAKLRPDRFSGMSGKMAAITAYVVGE